MLIYILDSGRGILWDVTKNQCLGNDIISPKIFILFLAVIKSQIYKVKGVKQ